MNYGVVGISVGLIVASGAAQPMVPAGFTVRLIAPLLDGTIPQVEAIEDPRYGTGVVTASANAATELVTFRLVEPSGAIRVIGTETLSDQDTTFLRVVRVRLAPTEAFGALLHASIVVQSFSKSILLTVDPSASVTRRFESSTGDTALDFDFGSIDGEPALLLLDGNSNGGSRLAYADEAYAIFQTSTNSVPPGRTDTDAQGLRLDVSGAYGGGLLLADTDDSDLRSAIYELDDVGAGGSYRAIFGPVPWSQRRYGDLDIVDVGSFGSVVYVTETLVDEIQQVAPDGTHTTWATGFAGIDSLSISPDGESMYVADLNGVWLIRPEGAEPGPTVLAQDPSTPGGTPMTGDPVASGRVIFNEPVSFTDADVTITDRTGTPVAFDASGSGSQFMIIGFAQPLFNDVYTITIADTLTSLATGQPLDGDNDGVAGADAVLTLEHRCAADPANPPFVYDLSDIDAFITAFSSGCATP